MKTEKQKVPPHIDSSPKWKEVFKCVDIIINLLLCHKFVIKLQILTVIFSQFIEIVFVDNKKTASLKFKI